MFRFQKDFILPNGGSMHACMHACLYSISPIQEIHSLFGRFILLLFRILNSNFGLFLCFGAHVSTSLEYIVYVGNKYSSMYMHMKITFTKIKNHTIGLRRVNSLACLRTLLLRL